MIKAIIVDDEIKGRQFLRQLVDKFIPQVKITGEAANAAEALEAIAEVQPDLVFLDIEMPGKSGIELLKEIPRINFEVIFVTAFNKYAVEAFKLGAVDYLLKPVSPPDLVRAIERVEAHLKIRDQQAKKYESLKQQFGQPFSKITIPTTTGFEFVDFADITYMQSDGNYTRIKQKDGKLILATRLLGEFEEMLLPYNFFRVHKSYIINLAHIKKYTKGEGGVVMMSDGSEIDVARRIKEAFLKKIQL
ncbi:MAG TPA: LytTR family DNA-binding domain-containing protein [Bacteroidia bacterium]|nr:LytTR family DNA-binding domain-containing protein [Bacteroidia bacterium]